MNSEKKLDMSQSGSVKYPQFTGKKVLIWGLGLNDGGVGMVDFFVDQGAKVTVTDGKTAEQLASALKKLDKYGSNIRYVLGEHKAEDFLNSDLIIRNPAIKPDNPFLKLAQDNNIPVEMEMSLFHQLAPCPIVGITGTKGKSTTTTLIYEMLKSKYGSEKILLAGNIGKSAIRELPNLTKDHIAVLELSSFQLAGMGASKVSSDIAVVTNVYTDHLNWHPDMKDYIESKENIFRNQKESGVVVINVDNEIVRGFEKDVPTDSTAVKISLKNEDVDYYLDDELDVIENGVPLLNIQTAEVKGMHNQYNILEAIAVARLYDVSAEQITQVLETFKGVEYRQQFIREIGRIKFYNDTTATALESMIAALDRFGPQNEGKIVMISGGVDKGIDYSLIKDRMVKYLKALVLLDGTASEKLSETVNGSGLHVEKFYDNLKDAVEKAYEIAHPGDIIILCPGASSFNMFVNEFDRGDQFNAIVRDL